MSLRDVQRVLDVSNWFYTQRNILFPAMDGDDAEDDFDLEEEADDDDEEEAEDAPRPFGHKVWAMRS